MTLSRLFPWFAALSALPLTFGCTADDDESKITVQRRDLAWDERSPLLGFSLAEALPDELYVSDLFWNDRSGDLKFSPSSSQTRLRWCLAVPDADSRIEEVKISCDHVETDTRACDNRLEAGLLLRLRSEDGALAEDLPVTFTAFDTDLAGFAAPDLAFTDFHGSFVISNVGSGDRTLRLGAFGDIDDRQASGSLFADWVTAGGAAGGDAVYTVANWKTARTPGSPGQRCADF
jgi:hypothetical protein